MSRTQIRFVAGFERGRKVPWPARRVGFQHRFAVIQETYRPDCPGMYFDEALWLRLIDFARGFLGGPVPVIVTEELEESALDDFLTAWRRIAPEDRLPETIVLRDERGATVLYIQPVFWVQVGGPAPYHDSYTYEIYSYDDIGARVMRFLRDAGEVWALDERVLRPGETGT